MHYAWTGTEILLDDSVFGNILDTFDRFNFTVKEDEPLEKEVAVDPEMLGKVFENLLDVKDRKSRGAFYTPREIVHYMCQQSLINYLETNTEVPIGDIEKFIQLGDFALDLMIKEQEQIKKYGRSYDIDEKYVLPKSIKENYLKIDRLLKDIKIVDPAVGSGAFPIGMMNEIVKARSVITVFFNESEQENRTNYNFKRETIENSLYGVDIDSSAVDIAKLRFWLSLIVDESDITDIQPLPNLDHKIMCGNSLLEEFEGVKLFDEELLGEIPKDNSFELEPIDREEQKLNQELHEIYTGKKENKGRSKEIKRELEKLKRKRKTILSSPKEDVPQLTLDKAFQNRRRESQIKLKELKRLQKLFFNEQSRESKRQYRSEIDRIEWELIEETLKEEGNEEAMERLEQYKKNKSKPFFLWKLYFSDVFQRENPGFDVVIANPPYVNTNEMKDMKDIYRTVYYTAFGSYDIYILFFEKSFDLLRTVGTSCFITSNKFIIADYGIKLRDLVLERYNLNKLIDLADCKRVFQSALVSPCVSIIKNEKIKSEDKVEISILHDNDVKLLPKIRSRKIKMNELVSGANKVFDIYVSGSSKTILNKLLFDSSKLNEIADVRTGVMGFDYWSMAEFIKDEPSTDSIRIATNGFIDKYLFTWGKKAKLYKKEFYHPFLDVKNCKLSKNTKNMFKNKKIIIRGVAKRLTANLDEEGIGLLVGVHSAIVKDLTKFNPRYVLALLNSSLLNWYHLIRFYTARIPEGSFKYPISFLSEIPIKEIAHEEQQPFIDIADQILFITKDDGYLDNPEKQAKSQRIGKRDR